MKISIMTPTYNRSKTLPQLYKSLIRNNKYCDSFEWLIMDDGSTDKTEELINKWIKENKINIRYYKQNNQGKMAAINNLIDRVKGELVIEIDSDDYLTDNCFKDVLIKYKDIKNNDKIYGLAFQKITKDNKPISNFKEGTYRVFDQYFKNNSSGDTCIVFKSKIRKHYKYKLEKNERFSTEGRMYHEIDLNYDGLQWYNIPGVVCEYLEDGYSKNINQIFKNSPYGYYEYYKEMFNHDMDKVSLKNRLHIIKHYILFSKLTDKKKLMVINNTKGNFNRILTTILVIPGYILTSVKFKDDRTKVLFISSTGGHLSEMMQLKSLFNNYNYHIITEKDKTTKELVKKYGSRIDYLVYGTKDRMLRYIFTFPYNILRSIYLFLKIRPKVVVTTGAHTSVPMCYIAKIFFRKIIFIETFANSTTKTLSGKLVYPIADRFIVQWESMLELYPKAINGGWIY